MATDDEYDDQIDEDENQEEETAYFCNSCGDDGDFEDFADRIEQDIVCYYLAAGADLDDTTTCEEMSRAVHDECCAFVGREDARKRGVNIHKSVHVWRIRSHFGSSHFGSSL